jgi:4-carboxymuconolactone decarboxylase
MKSALIMSSLAIAAAGGWFAATMFAGPATSKEPRFPQLTMDQLNEFAILIIGRQWRSQVEWYAHAPLAAKAGLSTDIIAELKAGRRPSNMAEDEAVVYDFVTELTTTQKVSDETYARTKKLFNDQQIVDLTAVAGNYVMVAMMLAMAEETVPPGKEPPFKVGEK